MKQIEECVLDNDLLIYIDLIKNSQEEFKVRFKDFLKFLNIFLLHWMVK